MSTDQETPESQVDAEIENEEQGDQLIDDETEQSVEAEQNDDSVVEQLKKELAEAEAKSQDNWDKAVRIQAEMENLKKRTQKDLENAHKFALENFTKELLPVIDSLELGLQAVNGESEEVQKFREGTELTLKQFESVFAKFNIQSIDPLGLPFDPQQHQAMSMMPSEDAEPNTVINVFQKGYILNERLIRPAMVVVAKAVDKPEGESPKIDEQA